MSQGFWILRASAAHRPDNIYDSCTHSVEDVVVVGTAVIVAAKAAVAFGLGAPLGALSVFSRQSRHSTSISPSRRHPYISQLELRTWPERHKLFVNAPAAKRPAGRETGRSVARNGSSLKPGKS